MTAPNTKSLWREVSLPSFPRLEAAPEVDVVIIGGGVTGLTAAYFALLAGKRVCLLERDRLGRGDTGNTTAHLTGVTDQRLRSLVRTFGEAGASLAWYSGFYAIEAIEEIVTTEGIDCDFQRVEAYLHESLIGEGDDRQDLEEEVRLAQKLGFELELVERCPIVDKVGIRFPQQGLFHPYKYLRGLSEAITRRGGLIFEHSEVHKIEDEPLTVEVNDQRIACERVMIATHVPIQGKTPTTSALLRQTKLIPRSSYVLSGKMPRGTLPSVSLFDTSDPYFYLRSESREDHDLVIFGGADHKTGQEVDTKKQYEQLESTLRSILPQIVIDHHWSGQVIETTDGLPYIGETAKGQFAACGFNGNGVTFGTIAAMMFRDYLVGATSPWAELYAMDRTTLKGDWWEYLKSNMDYPYYMIADRIWPGAAKLNGKLPNGKGEVITDGTQKIACATDAHGVSHRVSAICPHLGCIVHWNNAEQTWDCPCHGSRFKPDGELIAGPAESPLADLSAVSSAKANST